MAFHCTPVKFDGKRLFNRLGNRSSPLSRHIGRRVGTKADYLPESIPQHSPPLPDACRRGALINHTQHTRKSTAEGRIYVNELNAGFFFRHPKKWKQFFFLHPSVVSTARKLQHVSGRIFPLFVGAATKSSNLPISFLRSSRITRPIFTNNESFKSCFYKLSGYFKMTEIARQTRELSRNESAAFRRLSSRTISQAILLRIVSGRKWVVNFLSFHHIHWHLPVRALKNSHPPSRASTRV